MFSISMRRWAWAAVSAGADTVLFGWGVPSESKIVNMSGEVHLIGPIVDENDAVMYGAQGWMLKSEAVATDFAALNTLWDRYVPKEDGTLFYDQNTVADVDASIEPGLVNPAQIFGQELMAPYRWYQRMKLITLASRPVGYNPDGGGAGVDQYLATDLFNVDVKGPLQSGKQAAGCVFGIASPAWDQSAQNKVMAVITTGSMVGTLQIMKYIQDHLHSVVIALDTLWETGAESPHEDILELLMTEMERINSNSGGGAFTPETWQAGGVAMAQLIVPGTLTVKSIGPDSQA